MANKHQKITLIRAGATDCESGSPTSQSPQPAIGIWWADQNMIVALWHEAQDAERCGPFLDSSLEHWREWPKVASQFGKAPRSDYFNVPRGRVLLEKGTDKGIIYHGNETSPATLARIAKAFCIADYQTRIDEHYLMGAAADDLFNE